LKAALIDQLTEAKRRCTASGRPARLFRDFQYRTLHGSSCIRRVVDRTEHTLEGNKAKWPTHTQVRRTPADAAV
jgi:hypothetical protein